MKKIYNVLIIFLICVMIFFTFDYLQYKQECIKQKKEDPNNLYSPEKYMSFFTKQIGYTHSRLKNFSENENFFRKNIANSELNKKPPIILFGCSFTFGTMLEDNQTFSYKLSKLTKRNVYNYALEACGIQHMYYFLSNERFYKDISSASYPPPYVIYVYIPSHLQRLTSNIFPDIICQNGSLLLYNLQDNDLKQKKIPSFLFKSFLIKKIFYLIDKKNNQNTLEKKYKKFMLANELFLHSKEQLEKHYPNIKFVILKYNIDEKEEDINEMPFMWDVLKKEGFIIINSEDLVGRKFQNNSEDTAKDGYHPSEKAWDLLVPKLVEKLNL